MLQAMQQAATATPIHTTAFYLDWTFWQWVVAVSALILSQLPPLKTFLRPGRLKLDVPAKIAVTHKIGNPNISMVVSLRNVGGSDVRVKSIRLRLTRGNADSFEVGAQQFQFANSQNIVLFVPFALAPKERWTQSIMFYSELDRQIDKEFRAHRLAMQVQIRDRIAKRSKDETDKAVEVDAALVEPFNKLFEKQFRWLPGEYQMEVDIATEPVSAKLVQRYRFTLFESDTQELREHLAEFVYGGGGITFAGDRTTTVLAPITETDR